MKTGVDESFLFAEITLKSRKAIRTNEYRDTRPLFFLGTVLLTIDFPFRELIFQLQNRHVDLAYGIPLLRYRSADDR